MAKHGKKYQEAVKLLEQTKAYSPQEAIELAKKMTHTRFDETVELHLRMGLDPRNTSQQVRGVALLPHGLGKKVRVLVFAQGEAEKIAELENVIFKLLHILRSNHSKDIIFNIKNWINYKTNH